ncbi:TPA: hypothetical protein P2H94_002944 [Aeromonas veronii]|nr:hypothetical protein [Aeromonas veronii]
MARLRRQKRSLERAERVAF